MHLLQIWLTPEQRGIKPSYEQREFPRQERQGKLQLLAAKESANGALKIHQDAKLFAAELNSGQQVKHELAPGRHAPALGSKTALLKRDSKWRCGQLLLPLLPPAQLIDVFSQVARGLSACLPQTGQRCSGGAAVTEP